MTIRILRRTRCRATYKPELPKDRQYDYSTHVHLRRLLALARDGGGRTLGDGGREGVPGAQLSRDLQFRGRLLLVRTGPPCVLGGPRQPRGCQAKRVGRQRLRGRERRLQLLPLLRLASCRREEGLYLVLIAGDAGLCLRCPQRAGRRVGGAEGNPNRPKSFESKGKGKAFQRKHLNLREEPSTVSRHKRYPDCATGAPVVPRDTGFQRGRRLAFYVDPRTRRRCPWVPLPKKTIERYDNAATLAYDNAG